MLRVGSVWVCSAECRSNKVQAVETGQVQRESTRKAQVDKGPIREAVAKRDGRCCLLCGVVEDGLHLHRVVYGSQGGKYEVLNCVFLCEEHHQRTVHARKKVWQPLLLAHLAGDKRARARLRDQLRAERQGGLLG